MYNDNAIILSITLINVSICQNRFKRVINRTLKKWSVMTFLICCTFSLTNDSFVGHSQDIGIFHHSNPNTRIPSAIGYVNHLLAVPRTSAQDSSTWSPLIASRSISILLELKAATSSNGFWNKSIVPNTIANGQAICRARNVSC